MKRLPSVLGVVTVALLLAIFVVVWVRGSQAQPGCVNTGVVDAVAMRNPRIYATSENLFDGLTNVVYIQVGDPVPAATNVAIANGTARPYVVKMVADRTVLLDETVTADLWVHTTGVVCNFQGETHEHVGVGMTDPAQVRRDIFKWKMQEIPQTFVKEIPNAGWHRYMLWQQRSNGTTVMDLHVGGLTADPCRCRSLVETELGWVTP